MITDTEPPASSFNPHLGPRKVQTERYIDTARKDLGRFVEPKENVIHFSNIVEQAFIIGMKVDPNEAKEFLHLVDTHVSEVAKALEREKQNYFDSPDSYNHSTRLTPTILVRLATGRINTLIHSMPVTQYKNYDLAKHLKYPVKLMQFVHLFAVSGDNSRFDNIYKYAEEKGKLQSLKQAMHDITNPDESLSRLGLDKLSTIIESYNHDTFANEVSSRWQTKQ